MPFINPMSDIRSREEDRARKKYTTQPVQTKKTAYQQNLTQTAPQPQQKQTTRSTFADIYQTAQTDQLKASAMRKLFYRQQTDPTSQFYNAYIRPTNQAVSNLAAYGVDVSNINDEWFQNKSFLSGYLQYNGTTNTPSKPGKKSTMAENMAYEFFQVQKSEEQTRKAEQELAALREELAFKATRPDRNYSDDDIINSIDWSKYSTLASAKEAAAINQPMEFNRALRFSDDDLYGYIWSARNGYDGDDNDYAMAMSYLGEGKKWEYNADIAERLDSNSDKFKPYSVGSTGLDDAALYFGTATFGKDWLKEHNGMQWSQDETEKKMYQKVFSAEQNTLDAENQSAALTQWMSETLKNVTDYNEAVRLFERAYDDGEITIGKGKDRQTVKLDMLKKMDVSVGIKGQPGNGNLVSMTRAVDYKYEDVLSAISEICEKNAGKKTGDDALNDMTSANAKSEEEKTETIQPASAVTEPPTTQSEAPKKEDVDAVSGAAPMLSPDQIRDRYQTAQNANTPSGTTSGTSAATVAEPAEREKTPQELAEEEQDKKLARSTQILNNLFSEHEQKYVDAMPSIKGNRLTESFYEVKQGKLTGPVDTENLTNQKWVIQQASKLAVDADRDYMNIRFGTLAFRAEFERNQEEIGSLQDEIGQLRENYNINRQKTLALEDLPESLTIEIGTGITYPVTFVLGEDGQYHFDREQQNALSNEFTSRMEYSDDPENTLESLMKNAEEVLNKRNARASEISEAKKQFPNVSPDDVAGISLEDALEQINKLENRLTYCMDYEAKNLDQYNESTDKNHAADLRRARMADITNRDSGIFIDPETTDTILDYVSGFTFWERPQDEYFSTVKTLYDNYYRMRDSRTASGEELDLSEVDGYIETLDREMQNTQDILDSYDTLPEVYREKMTGYIDYLTQTKRQYENFKLFERDDFDKLVEAGKGAYWRLVIDENEGDEASTREATPGFSLMEPEEQEIYYALMALGGIERADQFYKDIEGSLLFRQEYNAESNMKEMAESGVLGRLFTEAYSIGSAVIEVPANVLYLMGSALYGEGNSWLRVPSNTAKKANEAVMQEVHNVYGGTIWDTIFSGAYEIMNNRGRSWLISDTIGGLMPGMDSLPEFAGEVVHSFPIATIAFGEAYEEAKDAGMSDLQAWTLGFINFTAESVTEGIKFGNYKDAFPEGMSLKTFKEFFADKLKGLDWLEEACGETLNNIIERAGNRYIGGDKSEHEKKKRQYIEAGLCKTDDEAEMLLMEDYLKEDIHTALISAVSSFADVIPFAAGKIQSTAYYAMEVSKLNRVGHNNVTISDLRARDHNAYQSIRALEESRAKVSDETKQGLENAEAVAEETQQEEKASEPALMPEELEAQKAKEEADTALDQEYDVDQIVLENLAGADQASQTSALAAVLRTDQRNAHQSIAATTEFVAQNGENSIAALQEVLEGGRKSKTGIQRLKLGIQYSLLADGECRRVVNSEEYKQADAETKARMLSEATVIDAQNQEVRAQVDAAIHETKVNIVQQQLLSEKENADKLADTENKRQDALKKTEDANRELETRRGIEETAAQAVTEASRKIETEGATDENVAELQKATDEQSKASQVTEEYRQSAENAEANQQTVIDETEREKQNVKTDVRQQAEQIVAQQEQQEREAAEKAAEEERVAREQAEKEAAERQAEEDRIRGKQKQEEDYANIDRLVDSYDADEETKTRLKQELKQRRDAIAEKKVDMTGRLSDSDSMLALGAFQRKLGTPIVFADDAELHGADGKYDPNTGIIYLNSRKAQDGSMRIGQALVQVALHEITHSLEQTKHYDAYKRIVKNILFGEGDAFDQAKYDLAIKQKQELYAKRGTELTPEEAESEIIADFAKYNLANSETVERLYDAGLLGRMRNTLHNINQAMKNFFGNMTGEERQTAENLRRAERAYQKALVERAKTEVHPGAEQFSVAQFAQATNMTYDEKTQTLFDATGRQVDGVKVKVTRQMIQQTPVGKLIDLGLSDDVLLDENGQPKIGEDGQVMTQKTAALDMFTGLMNMIAMLRDQNMVWEIAGGTLESAFSALKSNSDTQYHDTIDFGTICAKTQAIVNVMSEVMMDRLKANKLARQEGRLDDISYGLTRDDVLKIYNETHKTGLSVPCPVCYVFSRWMGVPSLLGQMSRFQHDYVAVEEDENGDPVLDENGYAKFDMEATKRNANEYIRKMHEKYGDKDGVNDRKNEIIKEIDKKEKRHTKIASEIERLNGIINNPASKKRSVDSAKKNIAALEAEMEQNARDTTALDEELREVEAYNWITQSLCKQIKVKDENGKSVTVNATDENGDYIIDPEFRVTPDEVLMDMRRTGEFADRYSKNWTYRTSRGAGMGKSILPYSGASLGDIILGSKDRVSVEENVLFSDDDAAKAKKIEDARERAKRQNLIGGQRLQSTSDFRPEWGLDYIMAFLELQAARSNAQMYTKVAEAIDLFASAGADVNMSIMGLGNGFHDASAEEIEQAKSDPELASRMGMVGDKTYVLDFSDVTGMRYADAKAKSKQYDNAQMILVGMNDTHIRLAMANGDIDFIIPWHSSGNSNDVLSQLVASVEETLETSSDYTSVQSDKFVTRKERQKNAETGKWETKTVDARTDAQKTLWAARIKILTGIAEKAVDAENPAKGGLTEAEFEAVKNNPYLMDLYERFYKREGDKCYGVALTASQAKQIFPYEYWQTDATKPGGTKETADENGRRFIEYCNALGVVPRFSGKWSKKTKSGDSGNFAGAVYDKDGNIVGYDADKMAKGYWKLLIDRKMYGLDGKYRDQKTIDTSNINIGSVSETGAISDDSMLPKETSAKYGIPALERQAAVASEKVIRKPFDLTEQGQDGQMLYSDSSDVTEAELDDMLRQAGVDYQSAVERGDMEAAKADVESAAEAAGYRKLGYHGTSESFTVFNRGAEGIHLGTLEQAQELAEDRYRTRSEYTDYVWTDIRDRVSEMDDEQRQSLVQDAYRQVKRYVKDTTIGQYDGDLSDTDAIKAYVDTVASAIEDHFGEEGGTFFSVKTFDREVGPRVMELYARINNPFVIGKDIVEWTPENIAGLILYPTAKERAVIPEVSLTDEQAETLGRIESGEITGEEAWDALSEVFEELGYDGIQYRNAYEGDRGSDSYIALRQSDVKSADTVTYDENGNVIPLTERFNPQNPDVRYSYSNPDGEATDAEMDDMLRQAGVDVGQQQEPQAPQTNPTQADQTTGIPYRQWGNNMAQDMDELSQQARDYVMNSPYAPDTNAEQIDRAVAWAKSIPINPGQNDRYTAVIDYVTSKRFDYRSADGQARMAVAMGLAVARNDVQAQVRLADIVNRQGTTLGQALQARKLFRLMTPEGRQSTLFNMLTQEQEALDARGLNVDLRFSDWVYRAAAAAQTEEDFARVRTAAAAELAAQLPISWKDRLQSLRMLSMLANPRTHIRNVIGNALFVPAVGIKNKLAAIGEHIFLDKGNRTKTLSPILKKSIRDFARQDAKVMEDTLRGEGKYNEQREIKSFQKPLGEFGTLLSKGNSWLLEKEDWIFLKGHYRRALGGWMQANGYTAEQLSEDKTLLDKGREYAIQEAQKATYRDFNELAKILNNAGKDAKTVWGKGVRFVTDAVLPFKKTPANILRRGLEYSPLGIAKSLTYDMYKMKQYMDYENGKLKALPDGAMSPSQVIDDICAGLSGTGVMALGFLLAGCGAVSCGLGDDEDELEKLKGAQKYAINPNKITETLFGAKLFGEDVTYTMDWAAPMSMPFFVGAAIREQVEEEGDVDIDSVLNAFGGIMEPVFNLSMLDGVNSLFQTSQYDDTNQLVQIGAKILSNYASSYVPSVLGAIARTIDDTRRKSYVESGKNQGIMGTFRYAWENVENKIPGVSQSNIPVRNVWGEAETADLAERIIENFISPGYVNEYEEDEVVNELGRLFDITGKASLIPSMPAKKLQYAASSSLSGKSYDETLKAERWDKLVETRGKAAYKELKEMMNTSYYKSADTDEQIKLIADVWDYANQLGRKELSPDYKMDDFGSDPVQTIIDKHVAKKQEEETKQYGKDLIKSLDAGDMSGFSDCVQGLKDAGKDDKYIKDKIGDEYRDQYKQAYLNNDNQKMIDIEMKLDATGYDFDFKKWRKDADKNANP